MPISHHTPKAHIHMGRAWPSSKRTWEWMPPAAFAQRYVWWRLLKLNLGLMISGLAIALVVKANMGNAPWGTLHGGISMHTGLSFGFIVQLSGLSLIALNYVIFRIKPGLGTGLDTLLLGPWINLYLSQPWLPEAQGWLWGTLQCTIGVMLIGLGGGLYISANFGAGPCDSLVLGLVGRFPYSIRVTKTGLDLAVIIASAFLCTTFGPGTVLYALTAGVFLQFFLRLFCPALAAESHPLSA